MKARKWTYIVGVLTVLVPMIVMGTYYGQDLGPKDSPTFVTTKNSGLGDGYIPKHTSDAVGLENSSLSESSGNITQTDSKYIATDEIRARDSGGLKLYDDSGAAGIFVEDGGQVGIGTTAPAAALEINHATGDSMRLTYNDANGSAANYVDFSVSSSGDLTVTPSGSHAGIVGGQSVKKTNVSDANYGTSALTSDYIVAFLTLTAARTATISTEDEDSGTATQPRVMIFKDESGSAATYNITISLESGGTIDGAANFVIDQPYQSVTIYLNGTNGFIY